MTDTSCEINLQSKRDIICHVAKVKLATSDFMANVIPFLVSVILTLLLRFRLLIKLEAKRYTVCIFHSGCTFSFVFTGLLSAVYSLQSSFSSQFSVVVRSIIDLNLNLMKIRTCEAGSQTQLLFLLLAASQQSSDRSDKSSWLIANLKVATLRLEFVQK